MATVGLLHPGEMGAAVGGCLVSVGHEVLWDPAGRSRASTGRALASRLPNARLEMLEGIGHVPQMEAPGSVAKMIDQFIREVEARRTDGRAAAAS